MKRIFAFFLAMTLLASMGVTALAAAEGIPENPYKFGYSGADFETPKDIPVLGTYDYSEVDEEVYKVTIKWPDMTFNYTVEDDRTWDPRTHTYLGEKEVFPEQDAISITVLNSSSTDVNVTAAFSPKDGNDILGLVFTGSNSKTRTISVMGGIVGGIDGQPPEGTFTLKPAKTPSADSLRDSGPTTIGTVTITVTDPNATP